MPSGTADLNLLFGIMAVQNDFVSRDALIEAMGAWVLDKSKSLGGILVERRHLSSERHVLLRALVAEHVKAHHDDPQRSLAAVPSASSIRQQLDPIADPDVQASLAIVGSGHLPDPDATTPEVRPEPGIRYRILRPHAKGGLGEVFVAEDVELHREVALKEIQTVHAQDAASRGRFLLEAEVTGRLEHPGIVPVYGLGQYADGRPFYAMRFIHGDNLKEAIRRFHEAESPARDPGERRLALRQLLGRFVDVCNAVAYAHSRGVLHRDLKPGNIMLGKYGETLVVDWGLAKAVGSRQQAAGSEEAAEPTLRPSSGSGVAATQLGFAIGTPAYMSPEQAAGQLDKLGPPSDIYSLGATLYALLTGQAPFREGDAGAVLQKVRNGEIVPPRRISSEIDAPLEAICLKAMALDPGRRYASAAELAEDIEHWLADEPVTAWPEPAVVRMQRWVRHHRVLVTSAAATLLVATVSLVVGVLLISVAYENERTARQDAQTAEAKAVAASETAEKRRIEAENNLKEAETQRARADANFAKAMAAVNDYLTHVSETELLQNPGMQPLRRDLLVSALKFYQDFLKERENDSTVQTAVAAAFLRVRKIYSEIGETVEARKAAEEAFKRYEALVTSHPEDASLQSGLAECHFWKGDYPMAIAIGKALVASQPSNVRYRRQLADVYNSLAIDQDRKGQRESALKSHELALAIREELVHENPESAEDRSELSATLNNIGVILAKTGRTADAITMYRRSVEHEQVAYSKSPSVIKFGRGLALSLGNIGSQEQSLEHSAEAIKAYEQALDVRRRLMRDNPAVMSLRRDFYQVCYALANAYRKGGKFAEAAQVSRDGLLIFEQLEDKTLDDWSFLAALRARCAEAVALGHGALTDAQKVEQERLRDQAIEALRQAVDRGYVALDYLKKNNDWSALRQRDDFKALVERMEQMAKARDLTGRSVNAPTGEEKDRLAAEALALREKLAKEHPNVLSHQADLAASQYSLGLAYTDLGAYEKASPLLKQALAARERLAKQEPKNAFYGADLAWTHLALGTLAWKTGKHAEAERAWKTAFEGLESVLRGGASETFRSQLANACLRVGEVY
jgi:serine/threonine-protein kinase